MQLHLIKYHWHSAASEKGNVVSFLVVIVKSVEEKLQCNVKL